MQIRHFDRLKTTDEINEALDKLPEGLEQTYRGILQRFGAATLDVQSVLGFVAFALRPLTVDDVFAVLFFNFATAETYSFEVEDRESVIFQQLPGLIEIVDVDGKRIVQFIHFSVKEYLTSDALRRDEHTCGYYLDRYSADIAIATLSLATFEPDNEGALGGLKGYAGEHWHEHIPPDVKDGIAEADTYVHPNAADRQEGAERLNSALSAFLNPESLAFKSWKATNYSGSATPLHCAVRFGLLGQVKRLLEQGADCNTFTEGYTPLATSMDYSTSSYACMDALLEHGADPNITHHNGSTPIHVAALLNDEDAYSRARRLLERGANINLRTTLQFYGCLIGATPLHIAVQEASFCELLLKWEGSGGLGAIPDWMGQTPLHYAVRMKEPRILTSLLEGGASAQTVDACGNTPLSLAAERRADECVKLLEEHIKRTSPSSESPYDQSAIQGPLSSIPTSDLALHAALELSNCASSSGELIQRTTIECSVNMSWSSDLLSVRNICMLSITLSSDDDGSDSVHCVAKLSGVNADGSLWRIIPSDPERSEEQSFSLSRKIQVDCCKETAASTSRVENVQQHIAEGAVPRLLVHFVPAPDELAFHSPMSFPVPPELP